MNIRPCNRQWLLAPMVIALALAADIVTAQEELNDNRTIKEHREPSQVMTEPVYRRLGAVHELMGEGDFSKALADLEKLNKIPLNAHEQALIDQTFGFIHIQQNR
ncbi:MAG: hypothetical protein R3288_09370, partial [Woeseiaceae bacterium]|nr:hypothetical protein [Woeseiaceae bacterium]